MDPWASLKLEICEHINEHTLAALKVALGAPAHKKTPLDILSWLEGQPNANGSGPKLSAQNTEILRVLFQDRRFGLANLLPLLEAYHTSQATASASTSKDLPVIPRDSVKLGKSIGKGTYGEVFDALWCGTVVAVKQLAVLSEREKARFARELTTHYSLRHPCVVQLLASTDVQLNGPHLLVMEFVDGGSLFDALYGARSVELATKVDVKQIAIDVASGLAYIHLRDVLHRDLRSPNVLLHTNWTRAKLCDFGLACAKEDAGAMSSVSAIGHTPAWTAPECVLSAKPVHTKMADVFSLGRVLFELCTKQRPFAGMTPIEILGQLMQKASPVMPDAVSPEWKRIVEQCTALDAASRPSASHVVNLLHALSVSTSSGNLSRDLQASPAVPSAPDVSATPPIPAEPSRVSPSEPLAKIQDAIRHDLHSEQQMRSVLATYGEKLPATERKKYETALNEVLAERLMLEDYLVTNMPPFATPSSLVQSTKLGSVLALPSENCSEWVCVTSIDGLNMPRYLAIFPDTGEIVVSGLGRKDWHIPGNSLKVYSAEGKFIREVGQLSPASSRDGEFDDPQAVAVTHENNLLVADRGNGRVQLLSRSFQFLKAFGKGVLRYPTGLAVAANGNFFVSGRNQSGGAQIWECTTGGVIKEFYSGGLAFPNLFVNPINGEIICPDCNAQCVHVISASGAHLRTLEGNPKFQCPWGVVIDRAGTIVLADFSPGNCLHVFSSEGALRGRCTAFFQNSVSKEIRSPTGLAITPSGHVAVAMCLENSTGYVGIIKPRAALTSGNQIRDPSIGPIETAALQLSKGPTATTSSAAVVVVLEATLTNGITLQLCRGDISNANVDAIVSAANSELLPKGGVSAALATKGGSSFTAACATWIQQHGVVPVGGIAYTTGGTLPCKYVIHAVGPEARSSYVPSQHDPTLRQLIERVMHQAQQLNCKSVALPPISCGHNSIPPQRCAAVIYATLGSLAAPFVGRVQIVIFAPDKTFKPFESQWLDQFLLARWPLLSDANDAAPEHRYNGTLVCRSPAVPLKEFPLVSENGRCGMNLDKSVCISVPALPITNGPFTLTAWIFVHDVTAPNPILADWATGGCSYLFSSGSTGVWLSTRNTRDLHKDILDVQGQQGRQCPKSKEWYHVSVVWETKERKAYFYLNGVLEHTAPMIRDDVALKVTDHAVHYIGLREDSQTSFHGILQDVCVFKKALTEAEVKLVFSQAINSRFIVAGQTKSLTERIVATMVVSAPAQQQPLTSRDPTGNGHPRLRVPVQPQGHHGEGLAGTRILLRNPATKCEMTIFGVNHVVWNPPDVANRAVFYPFDVDTMQETIRFGAQLFSCFQRAFPQGSTLQLIQQLECTSGQQPSSATRLQERVAHEVVVNGTPPTIDPRGSIVMQLRTAPADVPPIVGTRVLLRAAGQTMVLALPATSPAGWAQSLVAYISVLFASGTVLQVLLQVVDP